MEHLLWVWVLIRANSKASNCRENLVIDWHVRLILSVRGGKLETFSNEVGLGVWNYLGASLALASRAVIAAADLLVGDATRLPRIS